jgi:hypothetical protein
MNASRPSGSAFGVLVGVVVAAVVPARIVGAVVIVHPSIISCAGQVSQARQQRHVLGRFVLQVVLVLTSGARAQALERPAPLVRGANRSGRAVDAGGRYRRLAPTRVHFESLSYYPTSMPSHQWAARARALCLNERAGRRHCPVDRGAGSQSRGIERFLRQRERGERLFLLFDAQVERRLRTEAERTHPLQRLERGKSVGKAAAHVGSLT